MSAASIKKRAADRRAAGKGPKNTSHTTADGKGVRIKNGVKTYSDKPINVKGRSGQSISGRDYSINKGGTGYALTTDQLGTTSPVIPEPPRPDNVGDLLGMNNASVLQEGLTLQGGQFVPNPTASDQMNATREANMNMGNVANAMLGFLKPEGNQMERAYEDTYGISSREAGRDFRKAQQEVQQYTSQLNTLTASRDAEMLKLEGQGRGQTSGFIGGEQARINREAAIQALPVQAQLAAAQGNLEMAKSHVDSLFQMKLKDIDTMQAYKTTVANTFMSVATAQQQNLLNAAIADSNAKAEAKKTNLQMANQWAQTAFDNGQSTLAGRIMKLDQSSPTFQQDLSALQGQIVNTQLQMQQQSMRSQMYTESLQQQKLLAELNPTGDGEVSADLEAYGNEYAATGKLPSPSALKTAGLTAGQVADYAKQVPKANGVLVSKNTGAVDTRVGAAEQEDIKRLYNITKMVAELETLDKNRIGGLLAGTFGKITGSDAQGAYLTKRKAIVDEIARMQTGAALTIDEQDFYNEYLPGRFSEPLGLGRNSDKVIEDFGNIMNEKLSNALANNQMSIYGYSKTTVPGLGEKTVGDIIDIGGTQYRVLPDGTLTDII